MVKRGRRGEGKGEGERGRGRRELENKREGRGNHILKLIYSWCLNKVPTTKTSESITISCFSVFNYSINDGKT
jgi:hypothetical protein